MGLYAVKKDTIKNRGAESFFLFRDTLIDAEIKEEEFRSLSPNSFTKLRLFDQKRAWLFLSDFSYPFKGVDIGRIIAKSEGSEFYIPDDASWEIIDAWVRYLLPIAESKEANIGLLLSSSSLNKFRAELEDLNVYVGSSDIVREIKEDEEPPLHRGRYFRAASKDSFVTESFLTRSNYIGSVDKFSLANACFSYKEKDLGKPFKETLNELLIKSGKTNAQVYEDGGITRQVFSKIISNNDYEPKKTTIFCLIIGMHLNIEDANRLLESAGYLFSRSILTDTIVKDCICSNNYSLLEINSILDRHGLPCLGYRPH